MYSQKQNLYIMTLETTSLLQTLPGITKILLVMAIIGFSHLTMAATDVVTDDQIRRVAKIAKATKTNITITKERVTVTVHGGAKQNARKVKRTVSRIMKRRNYAPSQSRYSDDSPPDFASAAPMMNESRFRPPVLNNFGSKQPPVLGTPPRSSSSQPPVLDRPADTEDSGPYY